MNLFPRTEHSGARYWTWSLFGLMLAGSLCTEIKIPVVRVGLQNLLVPACATGILLLNRQRWSQVGTRLRGLLLALVTLSALAFAASLLSPSPTTSLYYWLKYHLLGIGLLALLVLCAERKDLWLSCRMVHGFLVVLALFGVLEAADPHNPVFPLFRSDMSLTIYPRVASLMAWPTQYGVVMAAGVVLAQLLGSADGVSRRWTLVWTALFLTQVAQSGSRNAWMALVVGLIWMGVRRMITVGRSAAIATAFLIVIFVLPVSARQTGLWDVSDSHAPDVGLLEPGQLRPHSLSPPGESLSLRRELWREAVGGIRAHPFFGLGLDAFRLEIGSRVMGRPGFNAHNLPLNIAVELGLTGLALAMVVGWQLLRNRQPGTQIAEAALVVVLASQLLDCHVHDATFMTLLYVFAAGLTSPTPTS